MSDDNNPQSISIGGASVSTSNRFPVDSGSGTAGTPSGGVQSVQGVSGGTAVPSSQGGSVLDLTPTTYAAGACTDGVILFDTASIASAFPDAAGLIYLLSAHVLDEDDQGMALDLIFLDSNQSLGTAGSAPNISDANARKIIGRVSIGTLDFYDMGANRIATVTVPTLPLKAAAASTTLYVAGISRGTGTYTASGLKLKLGKANGAVA